MAPAAGAVGGGLSGGAGDRVETGTGRPGCKKAGPSVTDRPFPVGDTGFEPVTSSV